MVIHYSIMGIQKFDFSVARHTMCKNNTNVMIKTGISFKLNRMIGQINSRHGMFIRDFGATDYAILTVPSNVSQWMVRKTT